MAWIICIFADPFNWLDDWLACLLAGIHIHTIVFTISVFVGQRNCYFCALVLIAIVMCFCDCTYCVQCALSLPTCPTSPFGPFAVAVGCRLSAFDSPLVSPFDSLLIWPAVGIFGGVITYGARKCAMAATKLTTGLCHCSGWLQLFSCFIVCYN